MSETSKYLGKTEVVKDLPDLAAKIAGGTLADMTQILFNGEACTLFTDTAAPTTSTVAFSVGDIYYETTNGVFYDCTGITVSNNVYTYTWTVRFKGISIDGSVITPTNGVAAIPLASSSTYGLVKVWYGTQAEYDAITTKDANTDYNIIEGTV